jgi:hypothetical protein
MKMLKKLSIVMLLSSLGDIQGLKAAEFELAWQHANNPENQHMYESPWDTQEKQIKPEYAELEKQIEPEYAELARLQMQAAREGISVPVLKGRLEEDRMANKDAIDVYGNYITPTTEVVLAARELKSAGEAQQEVLRARAIERMKFERALKTPEQIAAYEALMEREELRRGIYRDYLIMHPDHFTAVESSGGVTYVVKPEHKNQFETALRND